MHEELVAFAEEKGLELIIDPQGLNEIVAVTAEWNDANTGAQRTGTAVVTAVEGGKKDTVNLTQLAGA